MFGSPWGRVAGPASLVLLGALLSGCAADAPVTPALTPQSPAASDGSVAASATESAGGPTADASPGSMAQQPGATATAPVSGAASPGPSGALQAAVVKQIRAADQGAFDRVVIEFQGTFGAWRVEYQDAITEDPTGDPVALQGQAFVHVSIQNATFDNSFQAGNGVPAVAYAGPRRLTPGLSAVREIADAGDFEAVLALGIGVSHQAGLRAYRLEGPSRLVIDISH